jgi:ferrochelatase
MRHWRPRIAEAVEHALAGGAHTIVGLALAPHYSSMSIGKYREQLEAAVHGRAELRFVERWGMEEGFLELVSHRVRDAIGEGTHVVFTAHSLPASILDEGDPYPDELLATATALAERLLLRKWSLAYQSQSPTGVPWLGPDLLEHLDDLHAGGVADVLVCPVGFVADHLEILWDIDTEAAQRAAELGLRLRRIEMPNDDPAFVRTLAGIVRREAALPALL